MPVGNGRIGAMVFGGVTSEHIQFNEGTLRKGKPHEYQHADAAKALPRVRELCNESRSLWLEARALEKQGKKTEAAAKDKASRAKQKEAEDLGAAEFMSVPLRQMAASTRVNMFSIAIRYLVGCFSCPSSHEVAALLQGTRHE